MSYKARSTLTSKGQITLPVELRRRWDLKPGDCIDFSLEDDGRVIVRKWLRRSILEAREQLPPLKRPGGGAAK
ncbi:MAG TPA: AbrB/MazE/SpoVT family DNA-binding domain-containing protein [Xanthobacteraceae bacterium]|nr:AbrB/MazE/SpoVT family DNA-binding domain-containing protein [Xanthobacteraceae bacterium]